MAILRHGVRYRAVRINMRPLALITLLLLTACGSIGTVRSQVDNPAFQADNQPVRAIRAYIYNDRDIADMRDIKHGISQVNEMIEPQTGITVNIIGSEQISIQSRSFQPLMKEVETALRNTMDRRGCTRTGAYPQETLTCPKGEGYDIAIAVTSDTAYDYLARAAGIVASVPVLPRWEAYTDPMYHRVIVTKTLDPYALAHEIMHCFYLDRVHGDWGLMQSYPNPWLVFLPILNKSSYLTHADRETIMKYKWREFSWNVRPVDDEKMKQICTQYPEDCYIQRDRDKMEVWE